MAASSEGQRLPKAPRVSNEDRVRYLFAVLRVVANVQPSEIGADLEQQAIRQQPGWKRHFSDRLDEYESLLRLNAEQKAHLVRSLRPCQEEAGLLFGAILLGGWTICLATLCSLSWLLTPGPVVFLAAVGMAGLLGTATTASLSLFDSRVTAATPWQKRVLCGLAGILAMVGALLISESTMLLTQHFSKKAFQREREAYAADPGGFPAIRQFARDSFGIDVVLGGVEESWSVTSVHLPESSAGSISLKPGFCHLNMSPRGIKAGIGGRAGTNAALWVRGVAVHELGHCVDMWRDLVDATKRKVSTHAIAPVHATNVSDLPGYLVAAEQPATQQWREVFADIFLVGYWRLTAPEQATGLTDALSAYREAKANDDLIHYTTCWVDLAKKAPAPKELSELIAWADDQRATAACQLSAKPVPEGLKAKLRDLLGL